MPGPEITDLYQAATLWPATGGVDAEGQSKVGSPVTVYTRWNSSRQEIKRPDGTSVRLDAQAVVDRDVPIGSHMWLGTLETWNGSGSALPDNELMVVVGFPSQVDIKNREVRRTVGLMRLHRQGVA